MSKLSYKDLTDKMIASKTPTTQKWDVLCSYNEDKVNQIFIKEHAKNPKIASSEFSVVQHPHHMNPYTLKYNINLGNPSIKFLSGQSGQCEVKFLIADGSTVQTISDQAYAPDPIPVGYGISMIVPLANVSGDAVKKSGDVIIFDNKDVASVVLHFNTTTGIGDTISYYPPITDDDTKSILEGLITGFKDNIQDVDYVITTIKKEGEESKVSATTGIKLTPKSFIFTTSGEGEDASLSIWIQTNESGNPQGIFPNPVFQIGTDRYSPIPQNCTSSVIFNQDLIKKLYITPAIPVEYLDEGQGVVMKLKLNNYSKSYNFNYRNLPHNSESFECTDLFLDYNTNPLKIILLKNEVQIKWSWEQTLSYLLDKTEWLGPPTRPSSYTGKGQVKMTATLDKFEKVIFTDSDIEVNLDIDTKTDIQVDSEYIDNTSILENLIGIFGQDNTTLISDIKSTIKHLNIPPIKLGPLNFFSEANILFNDQVYHTTDGGFCGDVILVGNITD